jgi:hypothetical protein
VGQRMVGCVASSIATVRRAGSRGWGLVPLLCQESVSLLHKAEPHGELLKVCVRLSGPFLHTLLLLSGGIE